MSIVGTNSKSIEEFYLEALSVETGVSVALLQKNVSMLWTPDEERVATALGWVDKKGKASKLPFQARGFLWQGIDPFTGDACNKSIQFRPLNPRLDSKEKEIKYESVKVKDSDNFRSEPFFCQMENPDYWLDVLNNPVIPIYVTEGIKKAIHLNYHGYHAISIAGIWNFQKKGVLNETLTKFLTSSRTVYFCADVDWREKDGVRAAIERFCDLVTACECKVLLPQWNKEFKGIDDYGVKFGAIALSEAFQSALSFDEWKALCAEEKLRLKAFDTQFESSIPGGLVFRGVKENENKKLVPWERSIGNHIRGVAWVDSPEQAELSVLLEFKSIRGETRYLTMPRSGLIGDCSDLLRALMGMGYHYDHDNQKLLLKYLRELILTTSASFTKVSRAGWHENSFVREGRTYGDRLIRLGEIAPGKERDYTKGTHEEWVKNIAKYCRGNSRLTLAMLMPLAATLLEPMGIESGGIHFFGQTSSGKTTSARVAASVMGEPDREIKSWRTTSNAIEKTATNANHQCLILDEISQASPKDVGGIVYTLGNDQGKSRMTKTLESREPLYWRILYLSTGEYAFLAFMEKGGDAAKGGQEVRAVDIPADTEKGYGIFDVIHGFASPQFLADHLKDRCNSHYGTAFDLFLNQLVKEKSPEFTEQLKSRHKVVCQQLTPTGSTEAIGRVARRFALLQVAGELASDWCVIPHTHEEVSWAIAQCFNSWIKYRGGEGNMELQRATEHVKTVFAQTKGTTRIVPKADFAKGLVSNPKGILAIRDGDEGTFAADYYVLPEVFNAEFCRDIDSRALVAELQRLGMMESPDEKGRSQKTIRLGKETSKAYIFRPFWLETD
jgi:putative DNA primase/helicase